MNNWKKKISYFVLLPLVIVSWLMIFFRYKEIKRPEETLSPKEQVLINSRNQDEQVELLLNYKDPFMISVKKGNKNIHSENKPITAKTGNKVQSEKAMNKEANVLCRILVHKNDNVITGYKEGGILKLVTEK